MLKNLVISLFFLAFYGCGTTSPYFQYDPQGELNFPNPMLFSKSTQLEFLY